MRNSLSYFLFLLWLCYLIVSSILLFTRGFLLSRSSLPNISDCMPHEDIPCFFDDILNANGDNIQCSRNEKPSTSRNDYNKASSVCLTPKFKVILLIVDALRYDFTVYDESRDSSLPYQNKLPIIHKLLNRSPHSTRLFKFIADPPTTTMQRLKALTTGSLPTFIDAGSNFATPEINEDNIIDQIIKNNYDVVFMGDDTWNGLYPNRFIRNYPYPSFDVWDLDTVDTGVRQQLFPEMNKTDWNLLIGHFLGVDHCGHRYGPNHPEMARKLTEINTVIEEVVEHMDDDMMLFVIGDHGMTSTGDHGGESVDEVTAGLFVYSKSELVDIVPSTDSVKQIDIVPTLSTILGIPIPFQNLGVIILNCLPFQDYNVEQFKVPLYSLWSNVQQMVEYIEEYSKIDHVIKHEKIEETLRKYSQLKEKLASVTNQAVFLQFHKDTLTLLHNLRTLCEQVWVQFEPFSMARGLLFLFLSIFFTFIITDGIPMNRLPEIFQSSFLMCSYVALLIASGIGALCYFINLNDSLLPNIFFATGLISQLMLVMLILQNWEMISLNWYSKSHRERIPNLICRLVLVFSLCGLLSNSYIIEESFVLLFLLVTVILVGTVSIISPNVSFIESKKKSTFKLSKLKFILLAIIVAVLVRKSMYFWRCREEQQWCFNPHQESNKAMKMEVSKLQWVTTVVILAIFIFSMREWFRNCGNLNGYSLTVTIFKFFPNGIVVCISGYWALKNMHITKKSTYSPESVNTLAWAAYCMISLGILSCIIKPLCIYVTSTRDSLKQEQNIIPKLFQIIRRRSMKDEQNQLQEDVPVVCGLATSYSSTFLMLGLYLTLLFAFLLGDGVAPTAVIMFLTVFFVLLVTSVMRIEKATAIEQLFEVPNVSILVWIIMAQYFFYGTGHQPTFPNISWEAAFIGRDGTSKNNIIPATLILLNTFCSHIFMGIMLPLIIITPFTVMIMIPSMVGNKKTAELRAASERGEVVLFEKDSIMMTSMFTLACKYIMGHGIRVFASMLSATIHCRHLMVWGIFAPKLIFESIGMFATLISVLIGYWILVRVSKKVEKFVIELNKKNN